MATLAAPVLAGPSVLLTSTQPINVHCISSNSCASGLQGPDKDDYAEVNQNPLSVHTDRDACQGYHWLGFAMGSTTFTYWSTCIYDTPTVIECPDDTLMALGTGHPSIIPTIVAQQGTENVFADGGWRTAWSDGIDCTVAPGFDNFECTDGGCGECDADTFYNDEPCQEECSDGIFCLLSK